MAASRVKNLVAILLTLIVIKAVVLMLKRQKYWFFGENIVTSPQKQLLSIKNWFFSMMVECLK